MISMESLSQSILQASHYFKMTADANLFCFKWYFIRSGA